LTSALDGSESSASCSGRFARRERAPGTHWIGVVHKAIYSIFSDITMRLQAVDNSKDVLCHVLSFHNLN